MRRSNLFQIAKESIPGFWHQIPRNGEIPKSLEYHVITIEVKSVPQAIEPASIAIVKNLKAAEIPPGSEKVARQFVLDAARQFWGSHIAAVFFADEAPSRGSEAGDGE